MLGLSLPFPDAERDVAWLLEQLAARNARIAELQARLQRDEWALRSTFIPEGG